MRLLASALLLCASPAFAAMVEKPVEWELDGTAFQGVLVYDEAGDAARPGLLMTPSWMGITEHAIGQARRMAGDDYVILLVDMYGKDVRPANAEEAGKAAGAVYADPEALRARAAKALDVLKSNGAGAPLDPERIGAFGYCFGGAVSLEMARAGADLDAVVSFHGALGTSLPAAPGAVKAPLLVLNGADDAYVKPEEIAGLQQEMTAAGADWQFVNFSGAVHCFAYQDPNPPPGCRYDERTARRANAMMADFLAEAFGR